MAKGMTWLFWISDSAGLPIVALEPIIQAAYTVKQQCDGVLRWFQPNIFGGAIFVLNHRGDGPGQGSQLNR